MVDISYNYHVHSIHQGIKGELAESSSTTDSTKSQRYYANQIGALRWVLATLIDTSMAMYELFQGPLSIQNKEQFYRENKLFALLFGIPEDAMPEDWKSFRLYMEDMFTSDVLKAERIEREMVEMIFPMIVKTFEIDFPDQFMRLDLVPQLPPQN